MIKAINSIKDNIENNKPLMFTIKFFKIIFTIILVLILLVILVQKFSNNNLSIGGIKLYCVRSGSMEPEYTIGDILVTKEVQATDLKKGDNVTYIGKKDNLTGIIITHEIQSIREENGKYYFITKGTANEIADPEIEYDQIYGKVVYKTEILSYISKKSTSLFVYILVMIVGVITSIGIVKSIFAEMKKEDEDNEDDEEDKDDADAKEEEE